MSVTLPLMVLIGLTVYSIAFPQSASATTCGGGAGTVVGSNCVIYLTSGTSWTVPSDWTSTNNSIEVIGGGGGGGNGFAGWSGTGGGGGGYSKALNVSLTIGASVGYAVGGGGGAHSAGGDSYFCNSTSNCASISGTAVLVGAKGGGGGSNLNAQFGNGGSGGVFSSGVGTIRFSGGYGGTNGSGGYSGGGGGGAGGPGGDGGKGANYATSGSFGGGGGGGASGGSAGTVATSANGGAGGNNKAGSGGGAGGSSGVDGSAGSGGGGGGGGFYSSGSARSGGAGGAGADWDASHGGGGGGGGGGGTATASANGGAGGLYGGGGGGAGYGATTGSPGSGAQGIIVITYNLASWGAHNTITFTGNVQMTQSLNVGGALAKGAGTFVIDHPLDPANELLYHSFVESPDAKNVYDGIATLDDKGEATIALPDYFDALNGNVRYQFFAIDQAMPNLYIKDEEHDNQFAIGGGVPGGKVSWQITGVRHDPYILMHPIIVEELKSATTIVPPGECIFPPLCQ